MAHARSCVVAAFCLSAILLCARTAARADTDPAVLQAEAQRIAVMDKAKDAVLAIFSSAGTGGGSGVVISADGFALTNFHVVKPCGNAMKCGMADGKVYDAVVVGLDPTGDVALIKLVGRNDFPAATMGDSDKLRVGDWCFAMGNPFLLATDFRPTATYGIVSGVHRYQPPAGTLLEYADCIQTDASINPGNSGGPLFDAAGRLVGINGRGSFEKRGRVNVGVAYAISINQIKNFLGVLHSGRIVDHATLGATVSTDEDGRVVVSDILDGSDAYRRGLRLKDEIVSFGGRPISTPNGFKNVLGIYPKGWRVPLSFRRDGKRYDVLVRLTGVHDPEDLLEKAEGGPKIVPMPVPKPDDKPEEKPGRKPASGEKPKDAKPDAKPAEKPKGAPKVKPMPMMPRTAPMPEHLKKLFEEKRGYANYHFNKQQRDRVVAAWKNRCDLTGLRGTWTLSGTRDGGGKYGFTLTDAGGALKLPTEEVKWEAGDNLTDSLLPLQSGGLLPALFVLRRLAVEGPAKLDEVYYLGTAPLAGQPGLVDVVAGLHKKADCRFMFHPTEGHLLAMEFYGDDESDPCELLFSDYRQLDGRWLPGRIEVRVGEIPFAAFKIAEAKFEKPETK